VFVVQYQTTMILNNKNVKLLNKFLIFSYFSFDFIVPQINMDILFHELTIRGFMVSSFTKEYDAALTELAPLVKKVMNEKRLLD
jgi:hypothetical protein